MKDYSGDLREKAINASDVTPIVVSVLPANCYQGWRQTCLNRQKATRIKQSPVSSSRLSTDTLLRTTCRLRKWEANFGVTLLQAGWTLVQQDASF